MLCPFILILGWYELALMGISCVNTVCFWSHVIAFIIILGWFENSLMAISWLFPKMDNKKEANLRWRFALDVETKKYFPFWELFINFV